jgi:acyl-[acyl-carrier-protein]-phospholipid O-acyltransferase/long-chain-fatty-acid--[acyl-carrier-protein] ligase
VLLPNVNGAVVTLFGLSAFGRVPAMLNFTAGAKNLKSAARTAALKLLVTSRRFVDTAKLDEAIAALQGKEGGDLRVVYLEDMRKAVTSLDKLRAVIEAKFAARIHRRFAGGPDDEGIVLFTSGSEGEPKGVVLSHANLLANAGQIWQFATGVFSPEETFFNPLPIFHSFGLTAGLLTGLFNGMKVVLYPSPLHYRQIPKLIGETQSTILMATDTFLQGYGKAADSEDLASVKFAVAGAERVKDETRRIWARHGTVIIEGYGATECSPVICCNLPKINRPGSVGRFLPGIAHRLDPVEGIEIGGRLVVSGPNVMAGYLLPSQPGVVKPPAAGWHDTGDIVTISEDGFVSIRGRAKRFAKIGGEMVSLAAVETMISGLWPANNHVVVALPDAKKGEQIVLVTDKPDADKAELAQHARAEGFPELWVPKALLVVANIPVMGSGKLDYAATMEMARAMRAML